MKKFIISVLCMITIFGILYMLYTYKRFAYDLMLDTLGGFYLGRLIGKFADWLSDK